MPVQVTFFEKSNGTDTVFVLKTYDASLAREAFDCMGQPALKQLGETLSLNELLNPEDLSTSDDALAELVWEVMCDTAREFGQTRSFFGTRHAAPWTHSLEYVSGDWPSAQAFAETLLAK